VILAEVQKTRMLIEMQTAKTVFIRFQVKMRAVLGTALLAI
jgi:hypothetical protein